MSGDDYFTTMLDLYRNEETDAEGRPIVAPAVKLKIFQAFGAIDGTIKRSERDQGLSKLPAVHQHAHLTTVLPPLPKALYDSMTEAQKTEYLAYARGVEAAGGKALEMKA